MGPFPTVATLREWKAELSSQSLAASGRSDNILVPWTQRAEDKQYSFEDLGYVPTELVTLDRKISAAIISVTAGELQRSMALQQQRRIERDCLPLSAPQILRMVYESLQTTESLRSHNTVLMLSKLKWLGDGNIVTFRNNVVQVMGTCTPRRSMQPRPVTFS